MHFAVVVARSKHGNGHTARMQQTCSGKHHQADSLKHVSSYLCFCVRENGRRCLVAELARCRPGHSGGMMRWESDMRNALIATDVWGTYMTEGCAESLRLWI